MWKGCLGWSAVGFDRTIRVFSIKENTTLKLKNHNYSRYGSFVNQVFITEKLVPHLNICPNVYIRDQHFLYKGECGFCGSSEVVIL